MDDEVGYRKVLNNAFDGAWFYCEKKLQASGEEGREELKTGVSHCHRRYETARAALTVWNYCKGSRDV